MHDDDDPLDEFPLASTSSLPAVPPGLNEEEVGGAYVTVSQRAAAILDRPQTTERTIHP